MNESKISELSTEDLNFFVKSFQSISKQKIIDLNSSTKQKLEQFIDVITKYSEFPTAYSLIYSTIIKTYDNTPIEPGTVGSFLYGSLSNQQMNYMSNTKSELLKYVETNKNNNNPNVCSLLGAGSISKDTETYCSVPVIYYDGMSLVPLFSKLQEPLSSSLFGITPRTFKNINISSNLNRSFRVHRDDGILYLPIYSNNNNSITSITQTTKKQKIPSLSFEMINQLIDYGISNISVFLYEKQENNKYNIFYSGKYNLNKKKYIEFEIPNLDHSVPIIDDNRRSNSPEIIKTRVKWTLLNIIIAILITVFILYGISKLFDSYWK